MASGSLWVQIALRALVSSLLLFTCPSYVDAQNYFSDPEDEGSTSKRVNLNQEDMCDACMITIEAYAEQLRKAALNRSYLLNDKEANIDGNRVARELCEGLAVTHQEYVYFGCSKLFSEHRKEIFVPFNNQVKQSDISDSFVRKHKFEACRKVGSCPLELDYGDYNYKGSNCEKCTTLAVYANLFTRRFKQSSDDIDNKGGGGGGGGATGLASQYTVLLDDFCKSLPLRFHKSSKLETLCEDIMDEHQAKWASLLASKRQIRKDRGGLEPSESLSAKLCGATGTKMCKASDVKEVHQLKTMSPTPTPEDDMHDEDEQQTSNDGDGDDDDDDYHDDSFGRNSAEEAFDATPSSIPLNNKGNTMNKKQKSVQRINSKQEPRKSLAQEL
jgi:hypothetical protein